MAVKVIIPTALRQHTNNEDELRVDARTVSEALKELTTKFPKLGKYLYSENGRLRGFINIYLNEEDIRHGKGENTPLRDGDTLMIVPAVAGGDARAKMAFRFPPASRALQQTFPSCSRSDEGQCRPR